MVNDETISSENFEIDSTAPSEAITYTISPEGYTNENVILTLNKLSDADKIIYSTDGTNYTEYSAPLTITSNGNIYVKSIDVAENESIPQTIAITSIDRTNPNILIDASVNDKTINSTITLSDNGQIDYTKSKYIITNTSTVYDVNDSIWNSATLITQSPEKISMAKDIGNYYIQVLGVDKAKNEIVVVSDKIIIGITNNIIDTGYNDKQKVNGPTLISGMTPINWNGTTLTTTTVDDTNWYNYTTTNKQWANAQTADGSMWVWIPRYEYQITSLKHQSSSSGGNISIKFIPTSQITADSGYIIEPAFTFGDTQLSGIWVAKFEANGTTNNITVKPSIISLRYTTISDMFTACRNMETNQVYGWGTTGKNIDTHLMKNTEWGTVAYLAQSAYGKNSAVDPNLNVDCYTGGGFCNGGIAYGGDYIQNIAQSTTGNIYGIYDMAGGAFEYVAVYINDNSSFLKEYGSSLVNADSKYKDVYKKGCDANNQDDSTQNYNANSDMIGDAVYETSSSSSSDYNAPNTSWYNNASYMPNWRYPFFKRGGEYDSIKSSIGLFSFDTLDGSSGDSVGFRPVVAVSSSL